MGEKLNLKNRSILNNALWIISGKIMKMAIILLIGLFTARYLGPTNYGVLNYSAALIAFFAVISGLGLNSIIVNELIENSDHEGSIIGSGLVARILSGLLSVAILYVLIGLLSKNDSVMIYVTVFQSISIVFQAFELIEYWFQYKLQSKHVTIVQTLSYIIVAIYKITLIFLSKDIFWFAASNSIDMALIGLLLMGTYRKMGGQRLGFSMQITKKMIQKSYHFILSSLMVVIYAQMDRIVIGKFLNQEAVGLYSTAVGISLMWTFVLSAIVDSARPSIMKIRHSNYTSYEKSLSSLYSVVIWLSICISIIVTIFAGDLIRVLYGNQYLGAVVALRIYIWISVFSFVGVARSIWIVSENKGKFEKKFAFWGAISSIIFNLILIPILGIKGAAISSVFTQIISNIIVPTLYKETRGNTKLIVRGLLFKDVRNIK